MADLTQFIPHGMVMAFAGVVSFVFREHTKQDDARFNRIATALDAIEAGQTAMATKIADNHAEVLKLFIDAGQHAATNAAIAGVADRDARARDA